MFSDTCSLHFFDAEVQVWVMLFYDVRSGEELLLGVPWSMYRQSVVHHRDKTYTGLAYIHIVLSNIFEIFSQLTTVSSFL